MKRSFSIIAGAGMAGALALTGVLDASAQERVRWKMQSAFPSAEPINGRSAVDFSTNLENMTGGNFQMKFHEPNALVPALKTFPAVSKGSIDTAWTSPGYHVEYFGPVVSFFTAVPFGPGIGEYLAWKWHGGGNELRNELYAPEGVVAIDTICHGPETSGWFRTEVTNPMEYFKGLKMRFFGLGAQVMQKLGANTQLLAGADIFPALESNTIDATEYSMPINDLNAGFHQITKWNYFPGWHQQVSCGELLVSKPKWDSLSDLYKGMVTTAATEQTIRIYVLSEALNPGALNEMVEKHGVNVRRWDDATLAQLERAWLEVIDELSAGDPNFKKVADSYLAYRKVYRTWGDAQLLKGTYQMGG